MGEANAVRAPAEGMRFVGLTPELFRLMPVAEHLKGAYTLFGTGGAIEAAAKPGLALALIEGGRVIGAGGIFPIWQGRAFCWFIPGLWMERRHYARALHRCRRQLERLAAEGYHRLECTVATDARPNMAWARRLGFVPEGLMKRYAPDQVDHVMLRWEAPHG